MWWFFFVEIAFLVVTVTLVLNIYVSFKNTPWFVYLASWLGWFMSFAIVVLVPVDILASDYSNCMSTTNTATITTMATTTTIASGGGGGDGDGGGGGSISSSSSSTTICSEPLAYLPDDARVYLWRILYWCSFILTWLVYPFLQAYVTTGHFKTIDKIREALQHNIFFYVIAGVAGLIGIFYFVAVKELTWSSVVGIAMAAANAWGMFLVVALMGYGLVEIPRSLWRKTNRQLMFRYVKYQITSLHHGKIQAREYLTSTTKQIRKLADKMREHNPMHAYLDIIIKECPVPEFSEIRQQTEKSSDISYGKLVSLHVQIKSAKHNLRHAEALYSEMLKSAFDLEDIIAAKKNTQEKSITWSFQPPRSHRFATFFNTLEWIWYSYLDTTALLFLCFGCALLSCVIVWEEVTLAVSSVDLSIFSVLVKKFHLSNILSQVVVFLPLGYAALAAYSTLFRIRLFNYYRLIPHQETDSNSILFSAAYLCRLCAPLAYNFMTFLHLPEKSSFEIVMGSMDIVPFLGEHFYLYFPILILVVCSANLLNLTTRLLNCLRIKRFQFDENFNDSSIDEGNQILENERVRGAIALRTRNQQEDNRPMELLSLSTPINKNLPSTEPPKPKFSFKYGNSARFANEDEEITEDPIPDDAEKSRSDHDFPAMHRIFGKGRRNSPDSMQLLKST